MRHILNQWAYRVKNSGWEAWLSQKRQLKTKTKANQHNTWCKLEQRYGSREVREKEIPRHSPGRMSQALHCYLMSSYVPWPPLTLLFMGSLTPTLLFYQCTLLPSTIIVYVETPLGLLHHLLQLCTWKAERKLIQLMNKVWVRAYWVRAYWQWPTCVWVCLWHLLWLLR